MVARRPYVVVASPDGEERTVELGDNRLTIGRLPELNNVALDPDPQLLVTRQVHCLVEWENGDWWVGDNGSVNGTFLRRRQREELERVQGRTPITDGDTICILGLLAETGEPRYWSLAFHDPLMTRPVAALLPVLCLDYDWAQAKLYRTEGTTRQEISGLRPQEHKLIRYMVQRNEANGGAPVLCSYEELIAGLWGEEALHTRDEIASLVWRLRQKIEPDKANPRLLETEAGLGYRLRTCQRPR